MHMISEFIWHNYNYWVAIALMLIGFYAVINGGNLVKKLIGLAIFQTSVLLFYISASVVQGHAMPILQVGVENIAYTNPLPHVLMLTAIVVGVATLAVGLALTVRIKEAYGTIEEDAILIQNASDLEGMLALHQEIIASFKEGRAVSKKQMEMPVEKVHDALSSEPKRVVKKVVTKKATAKKPAKKATKKTTKSVAKKAQPESKATTAKTKKASTKKKVVVKKPTTTGDKK